jgi:hypothetical protein
VHGTNHLGTFRPEAITARRLLRARDPSTTRQQDRHDYHTEPDRGQVVQRRREVGSVGGGGVGVAVASGGLLNRLRGIPVILAATPGPGSG